MRSLVVLFALVAAAVAAPSAEKKRSVDHVYTTYTVPTAVSHQSRVDVHSSPTVVAAPLEYASVVAEPVLAARTVVAPAVYTGASAVSHQSRVDVHHSPAVVATAPVVAEQHVVAPTVVDARSLYTPALVKAQSVYAPAANVYSSGSSGLSQLSNFNVQPAPAVFEARSVYQPAVYSPSVYSPSVYSPSVYSPSVYSPSVYSPSVYSSSLQSPSVYSPSVYSSPSVYQPSLYAPSVYSSW